MGKTKSKKGMLMEWEVEGKPGTFTLFAHGLSLDFQFSVCTASAGNECLELRYIPHPLYPLPVPDPIPDFQYYTSIQPGEEGAASGPTVTLELDAYGVMECLEEFKDVGAAIASPFWHGSKFILKLALDGLRPDKLLRETKAEEGVTGTEVAQSSLLRDELRVLSGASPSRRLILKCAGKEFLAPNQDAVIAVSDALRRYAQDAANLEKPVDMTEYPKDVVSAAITALYTTGRDPNERDLLKLDANELKSLVKLTKVLKPTVELPLFWKRLEFVRPAFLLSFSKSSVNLSWHM